MSDTPPAATMTAFEPRLNDLLSQAGNGSPVHAAGLDLSRLDCGPPPWMGSPARATRRRGRDLESGGLALAQANLSRARLDEIDLGGANLRGATLAGAIGRSARFSGAILEEADLRDTDLSGADFTHIVAGQVRLSDAMLEDARFGGAAMRFAGPVEGSPRRGRLHRRRPLGTDFTGGRCRRTVFRNARLDEAKLADTNLTQADFEVCEPYQGCADGIAPPGGELYRRQARWRRLLRSRPFGHQPRPPQTRHLPPAPCPLLGRLAERHPDACRAARRCGRPRRWMAPSRRHKTSYLALEQNWKSIGDQDAASWAYKRGRRNGRHQAGAQAKAAWVARDMTGLTRHGYRWIADRFVEWLCDYGESLSRIHPRLRAADRRLRGALWNDGRPLHRRGAGGRADLQPDRP